MEIEALFYALPAFFSLNKQHIHPHFMLFIYTAPFWLSFSFLKLLNS